MASQDVHALLADILTEVGQLLQDIETVRQTELLRITFKIKSHAFYTNWLRDQDQWVAS